MTQHPGNSRYKHVQVCRSAIRQYTKLLIVSVPLSGFSFVSKVIRVCYVISLFKENLGQLSRPIKSKTKTSHDLRSRVFPRSSPLTLFASSSDLLRFRVLILYVCCDWPE